VHPSHALVASPDTEGDEGTLQLTVLPPTEAAPSRPRDLVLVLDRSGSMRGWKMTAARRAAGRIVDTLTGADRFAVLTFDTVVERPAGLPSSGLVAGTDRHRFRAVEHLAAVQARGGTELLAPLREALSLFAGDAERDRVLVLVTDGQVGNEDQLLRETADGLAGVRVHTVGIDKAVNAGFLGRLAAAGGGRCELVESEDRLDEAMERIHRRIGAPLVTGLTCQPDALDVLPDTTAAMPTASLASLDRSDAPARVPDLFPGAPLVLTGRYRGSARGALVVRGTGADGAQWHARVEPTIVDNPALAAVWARAHLRDLEDRYVAARRGQPVEELERRIVATSLRFSVLCRFTAYVAVDSRTVTDGAAPHRVIQPVEPAAGWDMLAGPAPAAAPMAMGMAMPMSIGTAMEAAIEAAAMPQSEPTGKAQARGPVRFPGAPERSASDAGRFAAARRAIWPPRLPTPGPPVDTFAAEAARLRAAAGAPERERRTLLADLASRLEALLRDRQPETVGGGPLAELRRLLNELRGDAALWVTAGEFAQLWQRMQELLDRLAGGMPPPAPPSPPPGPSPRRRDFWKRT
jgi:Ca-activated chloride channel family protein